MSSDPISSVGEVREQLKRLGYLDTGLDRFVLEGAPPRSPARAALRVAVRVGIAGGALLAVALAAAAAGLDPRLRASPGDLVVLLAYLGVAAALAVGGLAALLGLAAAAAARRGRTPSIAWSRGVGLGLALPALLYLAFWWRSHAESAPLPFQLVALALGTLLVLALGRFGALAAVAVLSAAGATASLPLAPRSRRWQLWTLGVAALVAAALVALASWAAPQKADTPGYAVVPTGFKVRVLAIDGLGRALAQQRIDAGEMPALAGLLARGAWGPLVAEPERVPLIVWTTVATGQGPEKHGVVALGARRLPGMRTGVSLDEESRVARVLARTGDLLRLTRSQAPSAELSAVKSFWNVASDKGFKVGLVNWWATWPAEPLRGYMVSDRTLFRLDAGGAAEREVYPPPVLARLQELRPPMVAAGGGDLATEAARARRIDAFHLSAADALRSEGAPDLEAVYLPGLDIVASQALQDPAGLDLASLGERLATVHEHCRWLDQQLQQTLATLGPQDVFVLVADPGRVGRRGPGGAQGLVALAGPPVEPGTLPPVSARDVAPTVLHLLGLPRSRELDGHVLERALAPGFTGAHPVRETESYGRRAPAAPAESTFDAEVLEQLKSLGYIQ